MNCNDDNIPIGKLIHQLQLKAKRFRKGLAKPLKTLGLGGC